MHYCPGWHGHVRLLRQAGQVMSTLPTQAPMPTCSMQPVKYEDGKVCWAELLYAPGIAELMHGKRGAPRAIRIPESDLVEMTAEARITGTAVSDVARNRIATALLDAQEPTTETRSRQLVARFLRQAMLRAVNMSDVDLAKHIKGIATIPGVSFAECRVFELERQHRQAEAELRWSSHVAIFQTSAQANG